MADCIITQITPQSSYKKKKTQHRKKMNKIKKI